MTAWRIGRRKHALMHGGGAAQSVRARWNSKGRFVIYAAEHYSTALIEVAAQFERLELSPTLVYTRIDIPDDASVEEVQPDDMPDWATDKSVTQPLGDAWYDSRRSLILIVPSTVAPGIERNVLINQHHPEFKRIVASEPAPIRCHPKLLAGNRPELLDGPIVG
jgi:RES domain-containing protein